MVSELDCWMEWIENQMAEEMYDVPTEDDMEEFVGGNVYTWKEVKPHWHYVYVDLNYKEHMD